MTIDRYKHLCRCRIVATFLNCSVLKVEQMTASKLDGYHKEALEYGALAHNDMVTQEFRAHQTAEAGLQ